MEKKNLFRNINQQFKMKDCDPSHIVGPEVDSELLQSTHPRFGTLNSYGETLTHTINVDFFDFQQRCPYDLPLASQKETLKSSFLLCDHH